jgi:ankyrin repeat protein
MISIENLSKLIDKNDWDKILKYLHNKKIKPNIKVSNGNFISHIAVANNRKEIIDYYSKFHKHLLSKSNDFGDNVYHIMAKFGYFNIMKQSLKNNSKVINLVNHNGDTILHYLVDNKNNYFEWLLDNFQNIDTNIVNNKGLTPLLKAINNSKSDNDLFFARVHKLKNYGADLNFPKSNYPLIKSIKQNKSYIANYLIKSGANVNIKDDDYLNPLLLSVFRELESTVNKLLENGADINYLGAEGDNNPMTLMLSRGNDRIINTLIENGFDLTKNDRNFNTPLHLVLSSKINIKPSILSKLLFYSDLNKQNINGDTSLHLFLKRYDWKNYQKILEKKELNIFIKNHKNIKPLDYIQSKDLPIFLNMITNSFLYNYGDLNKCNNIKKAKCRNKIKEYIMKNKKSIFDNSTDEKKKIKIIFEESKNRGQFNSDILHNVIYTVIILRRNKNLSIPFQFNDISIASSKMMILETTDFLSNTKPSIVISELTKVYHEYFFEFAPYLIIWRNNNLYFVDKNIELYTRKSLYSDKIRFLFFKLTLVTSETGTHANIIIFDKETGILERFEPYGVIPYLDNENIDKMIKIKLGSFLKVFLETKNKKLIYYSPKNLFNGVSFQIFSNDSSSKVKKLGDPTGFCLAWTYWYLEMRIKNPEIDPKKLIKKSENKIKESKKLKYRDQIFIDFIRNYALKLDEEKNKILIECGISKDNIYNMQFDSQDNKKVFRRVSKDINEIIVSRI